MKKYFLFLLLPILAISLSGCFKSSAEKSIEKKIEKQTGGQAKIDIDKGNTRFTLTDDKGGGTVNIDSSGDLNLPESWPDDIEVYSADIVSTITSDDGLNLVQQTEDEPKDVVEWYDNKYSKWEKSASMDIGGSIMRTYDRGSESFTVVVTTAEGKTMISNTYMANK